MSTNITSAPCAPMPGFVWISPEGQWLTHYETMAFEFDRTHFGTTDDLSRAFVGFELPNSGKGFEGNDVNNYVKIPATVHVVRTVRLCSNPATPESRTSE